MPDKRFFLTHDPLNLAEALDLADAATAAPLVANDEKFLLLKVAPQAKGDQEAVVYAQSPSAGKLIRQNNFGLCLTTKEIAATYDGGGTVASCDNPRLGFARIAARLHSERKIDIETGVHGQAQIGERVNIHPSAIIGERALIGEGSSIGAGVVIGPGVEIGTDAVIDAHVVITCALIGRGVKVKPGAKLGQSGFGFVEADSGLEAVPQLGRLLIGDNVEIGANTTLDRGTLDDTKIGDGTKIDNLVQIGHNVVIGRHCVIAAQVGVAGSTRIGDGVMIGGQAGLADHLEIGDEVQIAAKAGVMCSVPSGEKWGGYPARPIRRWLKETATLSTLLKKNK